LCGKAHPLYTSGGSSTPIGNTTIKNVLVSIYNDQATAARPISGGAEGKLVEDSIFFVDRYPGNIVDYALKQNSIYNRVTFHSPTADGLTPQSLIWFGAASDPYGVFMTDCVISGRRMPNLSSGEGLDVGGFHLYNCNIALAGPDAITSTGVAMTFHNCTFVDPMYLSYDRKLETFLDTGNPALAAASIDGMRGLGGGANFRGIPDASDAIAGLPENILKDVGDCESDLFRVASYRSDWSDPADGYGITLGDCYTVQDQVQGIIGAACWIHHTTGRLEAGSGTGTFPGAIAYSAINSTQPNMNTDGGTDGVWTFYYKVASMYSSYPRFALRMDPNHPPFAASGGEVGACVARIELYNKTTVPTYYPWGNPPDNQWHQTTINLATPPSMLVPSAAVTLTGRHDCNVFTNNYGVPDWNLDEIVLRDPSAPVSGVSDWGLF
jgi:hypothetical protein